MGENLSKVPWHIFLNSDQTIDEATDQYMRIVLDEIHECIPSREVLIRPRDKPGMTSEVRTLLRKCHRLHKIAQRSNSAGDIECHKLARKMAKSAWKRARKNYDEKMRAKLNNNDYSQKYYWKFVKNTMGRGSISIPMLVDGSKNYITDLEKCEAVNDFFVSQMTLNINVEPILPVLNFKTDLRLANIVVSENDVFNILKSLKVSKANGPDGIGNLVLKSCARSLLEPVSFLVNKSLNDGLFPQSWKTANVTPLFKKGGPTRY